MCLFGQGVGSVQGEWGENEGISSEDERSGIPISLAWPWPEIGNTEGEIELRRWRIQFWTFQSHNVEKKLRLEAGMHSYEMGHRNMNWVSGSSTRSSKSLLHHLVQFLFGCLYIYISLCHLKVLTDLRYQHSNWHEGYLGIEKESAAFRKIKELVMRDTDEIVWRRGEIHYLC